MLPLSQTARIPDPAVAVWQVEDVPAFWTKRMKADLGVDVPDDAQGCLQARRGP